MNILELAKYILIEFSDKEITQIKLQKLLYYLKSWGLVFGEFKMSDEFYHWDFGPVNKVIRNAYMHYGSKNIEIPISYDVELSNSQKKFINFIVESYGDFSGFQLSEMTHKEDPWNFTLKNEVISDQLILSYYSESEFAQNNPLDYDTEYYPVKSNAHFSFILDMDSNSANKLSSFENFNLWLLNKKTSKYQVTKTINDVFSSF